MATDECPTVATREQHLIARYSRVLGKFYARCTCGWITPPCESRQRAAFSAVSHRAGIARARAAAAAKERGDAR